MEAAMEADVDWRPHFLRYRLRETGSMHPMERNLMRAYQQYR
jgi:hypothetical protein